MNHPIQPLEMVDNVLRFKRNQIVRFLLDSKGVDLNMLAQMTFSSDDWNQFYQLIGYSVDGFYDISITDNNIANAATKMFDDPALSQQQAEVELFRNKLFRVRQHLNAIVNDVFEGDIEEGEA